MKGVWQAEIEVATLTVQTGPTFRSWRFWKSPLLVDLGLCVFSFSLALAFPPKAESRHFAERTVTGEISTRQSWLRRKLSRETRN
jgi:hypothetical protein